MTSEDVYWNIQNVKFKSFFLSRNAFIFFFPYVYHRSLLFVFFLNFKMELDGQNTKVSTHPLFIDYG